MTTAEFAVVSDRAIMFASVVFVIALFGHILEWATAIAKPLLAQPAGRDRSLVGASAGSQTISSVSARTEAESTHEPVGTHSELTSARVRMEIGARIGVALTVVATALLAVGVGTRGFATDPARVPWGNMYEFTLTSALGVAVIYLTLLRRFELRWLGLFVTGFEVLVLMLANLTLATQAGPLVPALHSYWLVIHVLAAILATGAFAVGALTSTMYLVGDWLTQRDAAPGLRSLFPSPDTLDRLSYRLHAVGFPLWTFAALIAGPIWAEYAWGSYWNWDPKEVWAFITWTIYAAYLHARVTAGWKGKGAAIIALVGFATLLFNFVGINFFFGASSQHSYAG